MTEFGQTLPALPQLYLDETPFVFTKTAFVAHVVKALETAGMVPIRNVWPYDPGVEPEKVVVENDVHIFPFDYPDSSTFTVNNVTYRPCIVLCSWYGDLATATDFARNTRRLVLIDAVRISGTFDINTMFIMNRRRVPAAAFFGFNAASSTAPPYNDADGCFIELNNWKPYAAFAGGTETEMLSVQYSFVYLGPAGLWVYFGTGNSGAQIGQHIAVGFGFGGGRISGRELVPDVNINRVNPVFPMYLKHDSASSDQYDSLANGGKGFQRSLIHGIQFNQKSTLDPVRCELLNLENTEIPIFPDYRPVTVPSPRVVTGGTGAHILGRVLIVPTETESDVGDFFAPVTSEIRSDGVQPGFGDIFTCPGLTFGDLSAPLGVREDPITLDDWYMVPTYASNQRMGLAFENGVTISALVGTTLQLTQTDNYTMTGPGGDGYTFPNLGGGLTDPTVVISNNQSPADQWVWDDTLNGGTSPPDSDDQMVATVSSLGGTSKTATCEWTIDLNAGDPEDTVYQVQFSVRNKDDATTEDTNPLEFDAFLFGVWVNLASVDSAGTNVAKAGFNYQTLTFNVPLDTTAPSQVRRLKIRWVARKTFSVNGNTVTIKEVRVLHNRYLI